MPSQTDDQVTKKRFLRLGIGSLLFDSRIENMFFKCPPPPRTLEKSQILGHNQRPNEFVRIRRWKVRQIYMVSCLSHMFNYSHALDRNRYIVKLSHDPQISDRNTRVCKPTAKAEYRIHHVSY